jgi:putative RNA 2'-phosphotransferase
MSTDAESTSKLLSYMLRHRPQEFGLVLDGQGWTEIDGVLAALAARGHAITHDNLLVLVRASDKQRFAVSRDGRRIRANQGHSVPVELGHAAADPPEVLFHGTVAAALAAIRAKGLTRGRRHHVHLSESREQAEAVGRRRGRAIVIEVRAGQMCGQGYVFLRSPNGVWLTDHVPPEFLGIPD